MLDDRLPSEPCVISGSIARRYARALLELSIEHKNVDAVQEQLSSLADLARASRELRDVFAHPAYTREQRANVVEAVCKKMRAPPLLRSFLLLLVQRGRARHLDSIARNFQDLADARAGRVRAKLLTSVDLKDSATLRVEKALERATGRKVVVEHVLAPQILGGAVAHVAGKVYDGSVLTFFERLRSDLKEPLGN